MVFSARAGAFLLALAGPALLPAAAAPPPAFRTDDPRYARHRARTTAPATTFDTDDLTPPHLAALADRLAATLRDMPLTGSRHDPD